MVACAWQCPFNLQLHSPTTHFVGKAAIKVPLRLLFDKYLKKTNDTAGSKDPMADRHRVSELPNTDSSAQHSEPPIRPLGSIFAPHAQLDYKLREFRASRLQDHQELYLYLNFKKF